jgi:hypothetical protein
VERSSAAFRARPSEPGEQPAGEVDAHHRAALVAEVAAPQQSRRLLHPIQYLGRQHLGTTRRVVVAELEPGPAQLVGHRGREVPAGGCRRENAATARHRQRWSRLCPTISRRVMTSSRAKKLWDSPSGANTSEATAPS